jgi:hypothetical protein
VSRKVAVMQPGWFALMVPVWQSALDAVLPTCGAGTPAVTWHFVMHVLLLLVSVCCTSCRFD